MDVLKAIIDCLTGNEHESSQHHSRISYHDKAVRSEKEDLIAADVLEILFTAKKPGQDLKEQLDQIVHTEGWYEGLAKRLLDNLVAALKAEKAMGAAMKAAYDRVYRIAEDFVQKHPVYAAAILTVIAIGVLVLLAPWIVEALGFGELGPMPGSFAAMWQSTFPDAEAGSFFAYLQRLGMIWGGK